MRGHNANELTTTANVIGPDGTGRIEGISAGVVDLTGKALEQSQLIASETSHRILFHTADVVGQLDTSCYIVADGGTYIVDYLIDPRVPRPGRWTEVFCHLVKGAQNA